MQRNREIVTDCFERMMRSAAGAHVVFGVNLEEDVLAAFGYDGRQMFMLEARAGEPRYWIGRKAETGSCVKFCEISSQRSFRLSFPATVDAWAGRSRLKRA